MKLLCSFALVLAAMPIRASGMAACNLPVVATKSHCGKACCEKSPAVGDSVCQMPHAEKVSAKSDCCGPSGALAKASPAKARVSLPDPCKCELTSLPAASFENTVPGAGFDFHPVLWAPAPAIKAQFVLDFVEPGIVGIDSGPPVSVEFCPDLGRAPPVARA